MKKWLDFCDNDAPAGLSPAGDRKDVALSGGNYSTSLIRSHTDLVPKDAQAYSRDMHDHVIRLLSTISLLDAFRMALTSRHDRRAISV